MPSYLHRRGMPRLHRCGFFSFEDPEKNTREQIKKVRAHPWIAASVPVRGFIFDVDTGLMKEVQP
jgi:carbonic anhydrase